MLVPKSKAVLVIPNAEIINGTLKAQIVGLPAKMRRICIQHPLAEYTVSVRSALIYSKCAGSLKTQMLPCSNKGRIIHTYQSVNSQILIHSYYRPSFIYIVAHKAQNVNDLNKINRMKMTEFVRKDDYLLRTIRGEALYDKNRAQGATRAINRGPFRGVESSRSDAPSNFDFTVAKSRFL